MLEPCAPATRCGLPTRPQLAAALLVAPEERPTLGFVCLDARLSEAAEREGLEPSPAPS
jgi:hypothetical protein